MNGYSVNEIEEYCKKLHKDFGTHACSHCNGELYRLCKICCTNFGKQKDVIELPYKQMIKWCGSGTRWAVYYREDINQIIYQEVFKTEKAADKFIADLQKRKTYRHSIEDGNNTTIVDADKIQDAIHSNTSFIKSEILSLLQSSADRLHTLCDNCTHNCGYSGCNRTGECSEFNEYSRIISLERELSEKDILLLPTEPVYYIVNKTDIDNAFVSSKPIDTLTVYELKDLEKYGYFTNKYSAEAHLASLKGANNG